MKLPTMDILAKARQLESQIARHLDRAARHLVRSKSHDPLEIAHAVVERVEDKIEPGGRGRRVFPFTRVAVSVVAASAEARARLDAVLGSTPTLRDRIADRLASAGCSTPPPAVTVDYVARAHKNWSNPDFDVRFARVDEKPAPTPSASTAARLELTLVHGLAERKSYVLAAPRIDIGRGREVRDSRHRLIRANDIAFTESADTVNQTVSRQHAHIVYDEASAAFRVRDDGSAHGTAVMRGSKTITVPGGARGVKLQAGDEIVLGDARIRVKLG